MGKEHGSFDLRACEPIAQPYCAISPKISSRIASARASCSGWTKLWLVSTSSLEAISCSQNRTGYPPSACLAAFPRFTDGSTFHRKILGDSEILLLAHAYQSATRPGASSTLAG